MQQRQWDAKTKARIVVQGLQGKPVAELCNEYQISPSLYYQWRDQFLAHADKAFEVLMTPAKRPISSGRMPSSRASWEICSWS
jgi:transposase-like protein